MFKKSLLEKYKTACIIIFHTIVILIILNVALGIVFYIRDSYFKPNPVIKKYGLDLIQQAYPNRNKGDIIELLNESWSRPMAYDSFTGFKERPWTGKYVNVSETGYRLIKNQAPWPPTEDKINIFVFGGSTAFGYGVSDEETIASYLQESLEQSGYSNIAVYNFGRGHYFSAQERGLFEKLLISEHTPTIAIFIDGLNEFYADGEPRSVEDIGNFFEGNWKSVIIPKIPMYRAMTSLRQRLKNRFSSKIEITSTEEKETEMFNNTTTTRQIIDKYEQNKKIIDSVAEIYKVKTLFVWQPVPLYKYDLDYHLFTKELDPSLGTAIFSKYTYPKMLEEVKKNKLGSNFLWAADIQENSQQSLYIDSVHYAPSLAKMLAEKITAFLKNNGYL